MARLLDSCVDFARSFLSNGEVLIIECCVQCFVREYGWKMVNRCFHSRVNDSFNNTVLGHRINW